uniref:Eva-1 homolog C n=1 Tax=Gasterosteus aculeatus aculeatus TaxID=481459 RepID=G3QBE3_GASAC
MSCTRPFHGADFSHSLFYLTLLLWTRRMSGLADFSTEHKRHVVCEGETMTLRCKPPKLLNIYAAVYGRSLGQTPTCPSHLTRPLPPFECLNHEAVHVVSESCYGKQKCAVAIGNQTFRDPCFPGTRKYLSVLYSCVVPQSLLREADPDLFASTSSPPVDTEKALPGDPDGSFPKGSRRPYNSRAVMSSSLLTYAYVKEHPEMAALLFTSSVCVGLMLTLLAVSVRVTCRGRQAGDDGPAAASRRLAADRREEDDSDGGDDDDDDDEEDEDDVGERTGSSLISAGERRGTRGWEEVTYVSEAAELAERIERREMIIQEIWMNASPDGSPC